MISILIPVYNYDCCRLITDLHNQCTSLNIVFEIRVIDDASIPEIKIKNHPIKSLLHVIYDELNINIGRSAIRNKLAATARYQNLLFIDCDAEIANPQYIQNYVSQIKQNKIVCGGLTYSAIKPKQIYCLRWYYGKKIETRSATDRQLNEWQSFSFFNTLIDKSIFSAIECNELIKKYGHEDTLFGCSLAQQNIHVKHIENPLIHTGLNTNRSFILKTKEGIDSLYRLSKTEFGNQIKDFSGLLTSIQTLKKMHLLSLFASFYRVFGIRIEYLISIFPKQLMLFQFLKLCYLARLYKQHD